MIIEFEGIESNVDKAVSASNSLLKNQEFYDGIRNHPGFDHSNASPAQIAEFIQSSSLTFFVDLYTGRRRSKVLGYVTASSPNRLFLNDRKLGRRIESIAATIIHESVHAVDHSIKDYYFGHKGNHSNGNQNTAPYWIGKLAKQLLIGSPLLVAVDYANTVSSVIDIEENILDANPLRVA